MSYNFMYVYLFFFIYECVHLYFVLETAGTKDKVKPSPAKKGND